MLTFPIYLCLFLVPMLLKIWGSDLRLSLFFIGKKWLSHEKCLSCMRDYEQRFVVETPYLQELPMKLSGSEAEAKTTLHIDWTLEMTHEEMLSLLRDFTERHPQARASSVFLCLAPLWLCTSLRMVSLKPLITFDLPNFDLGAPPGLRGLASSNDGRAHRHIVRMAYRHFVKDMPLGPPLRALLVREDMWRSYHNIETFNTGTAIPFVAALSIYLQARYACHERADVLVMREGSQYRWAPSFRGRLFYTTLQQFETRSSPWRFHVIYNSRQRLSFDELAAHRAALWIQLTPASKITLKDLITMEMPIFVPDEAMQSSIAGRIGFHGCRKLAKADAPWAYTLCREVKYPQSRMQMSPLFRYPHLQHFESITDLVLKLSGFDCDGLRAISARMRRWNEALIADDAEFWRNSVLALAAWDALPAEVDPSGEVHFEPPEGASSSSTAGAPSFRFPEGPPGWVPAGGQASDSCGLLAAHCSFETEIDEPSDGRAQGEWRTGPYECCANAFAMQHGPFGPNASASAALPGGGLGGGPGGCLVNASLCSDAVLKYGLHLLQDLPSLDDAA